MIAKLALENGTVFEGECFGATGEVSGEVVFNTSMSGYQEVYTDPSYRGQIVTLTYPLIGNYGIAPEDMESGRPQVSGVIVREYMPQPSNFRATGDLAGWLKSHGVIAITGIDTRMLTRMIRTQGALRGVLSTADLDNDSLVRKANAIPSMAGQDLATKVTCEKPYSWDATDTTPFALAAGKPADATRRMRVFAYDYGIKQNILRRLTMYGCDVTVVPAAYPADQMLAAKPDGVFLSNGPGDPAPVTAAIENIRKLLGRVPIFGICLGHQLLALALGGKTYKLKFGHRGGNHPVKNLLTGKIEITSQNHGFAVDPESLEASEIEVTHLNLYDGTNEGLRHRRLQAFSVQYHPEASPGPHDSDYLFKEFMGMMTGHDEGQPQPADRR